MTDAKTSPQAKWAAKNQTAVWAHSALRSALKRGLIERQPCAECGAETVDAHHPNYAEPMAVVWLCRACHKAEHKKARNGQ